jgi:hypothetical protein
MNVMDKVQCAVYAKEIEGASTIRNSRMDLVDNVDVYIRVRSVIGGTHFQMKYYWLWKLS